ncbi:MAG TPA: geranylgeranylglycerol-phosphate geranylgeranyltransferase [Rubricoccaceae bacterium]|nr:geranylgeranylglycerol-phosphate geranylgeranyltransferase [Rubricoccaceae bacterium]
MLLGLLRLLRPFNFALFFAGVALGGILAAGADAFGSPRAGRLLLAMVSAALVGGAANAINDVYDLEIDRVNRPGRPLPSGQATPEAVRLLWAVLSVLGVALGALVSPLHGVLAVVTVALLFAYSAQLKRTPGWGHLVIALVLGLAVCYGGLAARPERWGLALVGAAFAFLTTLAREGAKAIEDVEGDAAHGARTLAVAWGPRPTGWAVLAVVGLTLVLLPLTAWTALGASFLGWALPAGAALLAVLWVLLDADAGALAGDPEAWTRGAARASRWLKTAMVAGVLALALARLG